MSIKIEFITPSRTVLFNNMQYRLFRRLIGFYRNTFPILSSLSPTDCKISVTDETVQPLVLNKNIDILGISIDTQVANRGYEIAKKYRKLYNKLGKPLTIVFGGSHASALPEEPLQYCDCVIVGEAELLWPQFLSDFKNGSVKKLYPADGKHLYPNMCNVPIPDRDLIHGRSLYQIDSIQFTRGCPKACEFCSIGTGYKLRRMSLNNAENDLKNVRSKVVAILDDNLFGRIGENGKLISDDLDYFYKIMTLLHKYNKIWGCQMPLRAATVPGLMADMKKQGCRAVYLGLESIDSENTLKNSHLNSAELVKKIRSQGIYIMAGFVFGFDKDTAEVFQKTLRFTEQIKLNMASFHILTPYPGTRLYDRLENENRILLPNQWNFYDTKHVVFQPNLMTVNELENGFLKTVRSFYSPRSILSRCSNKPSIHYLANILYYLGLLNKCKSASIA